MLRQTLVFFASDADRAAASDGRGTASAADAFGWEYLLHGGTWWCLTTGAARGPAEVQILPAALGGQLGAAPQPRACLAVSLAGAAPLPSRPASRSSRCGWTVRASTRV